jgi:2-isopropylmalate synthase
MTPTTVQLYDTTLRDGMQGEGMSLTAPEKLRVVHRLDALGIDFIEAGFLSSNPKDAELFAQLERESLSHATVVAFGMTRDGRQLGPGLHPRGKDVDAAPREGRPRGP